MVTKMHNDNENQFLIPTANMAKLEEKFAKLARKCEKRNWPSVSFKVIEHVVTHHKSPFGIRFEKHYELVEVSSEVPRIEGYEFLGALDHVSIKGAVMMRSVPGVEMPEVYRNSDNRCDHCGAKRNRSNTFVMRNISDGTTLRVGSSCVKDFIGYDPKRIASYLTFIPELFEDMNEFSGERFDPEYSLTDVLAITAHMITLFGWVSKGAAQDEMLTPTVSHVCAYLNPVTEDEKEFFHSVVITDEEKKAGEAAVLWAAGQEITNDYIHNIKAIAMSGSTTMRTLGIACSIMSGYFRAMEQLKEQQSKVSEWVGEIKKRQDMTLTLTRKTPIDGAYGITTIHNFLDIDGRVIVWFASGYTELSVGRTYNVKATVKGHGDYKDMKQTTVTRVKVVEEK